MSSTNVPNVFELFFINAHTIHFEKCCCANVWYTYETDEISERKKNEKRTFFLVEQLSKDERYEDTIHEQMRHKFSSELSSCNTPRSAPKHSSKVSVLILWTANGQITVRHLLTAATRSRRCSGFSPGSNWKRLVIIGEIGVRLRSGTSQLLIDWVRSFGFIASDNSDQKRASRIGLAWLYQ